MCVCVCICAHTQACAHVCRGVCMHVEAGRRQPLGIPQELSASASWRQSFSLYWNLIIRLDWAGAEAQECTCFYLPFQHWKHRTLHHTRPFYVIRELRSNAFIANTLPTKLPTSQFLCISLYTPGTTVDVLEPS